MRKRHTGLYLAPSDVPASVELEAWVQSLARIGMTVVLLDVGTREGASDERGEPPIMGDPGKVYFQTSLAAMGRDLFGELVPIAHRYGLSVVAAVSLRRMNWVDPTLGWMDRSYDATRLQLRLTPYLDLFHPAFQEYLIGLFSDLAGTGIDGVLFRNDAPLGLHDGFSPFAIRDFERDFHIRVDPTKLAPPDDSNLAALSRDAQGERSSGGYPAEFWQWAGWKARETIKVMARLQRAMRVHAPAMTIALEIHSEAITDPLPALVQYGEDLLEAKRNRFDFFFVRAPLQENSFSVSLIERAGQLIGDMEKVWMPAMAAGNVRRTQEWRMPLMQQEQFDRRVGLIYMTN